MDFHAASSVFRLTGGVFRDILLLTIRNTLDIRMPSCYTYTTLYTFCHKSVEFFSKLRGFFQKALEKQDIQVV